MRLECGASSPSGTNADASPFPRLAERSARATNHPHSAAEAWTRVSELGHSGAREATLIHKRSRAEHQLITGLTLELAAGAARSSALRSAVTGGSCELNPAPPRGRSLGVHYGPSTPPFLACCNGYSR
jgi:hypothetical protein